MDFMIVGVAVLITILAFALPENVFRTPMLHGIAVLIWLIATWILVMGAIGLYPGTYLPEAVGLFGLSAVIVHIVAILLPYIRGRKSEDTMYSERQAAYRTKIATMSHRKTRMWWE